MPKPLFDIKSSHACRHFIRMMIDETTEVSTIGQEEEEEEEAAQGCTDTQSDIEKKVKVRSYIARYPVRSTDQSALHFTPWQTCSFQDHLNFSEKH